MKKKKNSSPTPSLRKRRGSITRKNESLSFQERDLG
jgi:hypothetical protein